MLRDYTVTLDPALINSAFEKFKINVDAVKNDRRLLNFQVLSPDSNLWRFIIAGSVYYLYTEDFVDGLDSVRTKITQTLPEDVQLEFIEVKVPESFSATTSELFESQSEDESLMDYAQPDGYDFIFLCKSDEQTVGEDSYDTLYER